MGGKENALMGCKCNQRHRAGGINRGVAEGARPAYT